jgi:putative two-component system response regulator
MRVLIADDDQMARMLLETALIGWGYEVVVARDGDEALQAMQGDSPIHLAMLDWEMPGMNGLELCRHIRSTNGAGYVYVIMLSGRDSTEDIVRGMEAGADDYVTKPFDNNELKARIRAGERILEMETKEMVIFAMAQLAESRDSDTGRHLDRIREYSQALARHLKNQSKFDGQIDTSFVETIYLTSPLHDIGKLAIPDYILLKPDRLTEREFEIMTTHTTIGFETLDEVAAVYPSKSFLNMSKDIALCHHEQFDGSGYPQGLKGNQIPLSARIVSLADVYDALTSKRVYKNAFEHEVAKGIILGGRGNQFDPDVVDAFCSLEKDFVEIRKRLLG